MKKLAILFLLIYSPFLNAQEIHDLAGEIESIMQKSVKLPDSPDVGSIEKYGNTNISHYSGLVDLSIPLYSIDLDGKEIPISMSYYSGGIQVEEDAGRVGLGWTLHAGGCIVQSVYDKSDLSESVIHMTMPEPDGRYLFDYNYYKQYLFDLRIKNNYSLYLSERYPSHIGNNDLDYQFRDDFMNYRDIGRDIFSINIPGILSAKFMIKSDLESYDNYNITDNEIIFLNREHHKVFFIRNASNSNEYGIKVIADDGYEYYFYKIKKNYSTSLTSLSNGTLSNASNPSHSSTYFYLTKIVSPKGNYIDFDYTSSITHFQDNIQSVSHFSSFVIRNKFNIPYIDNAHLSKTYPGITLTYSIDSENNMTHTQYEISKIKTNNIEIEFINHNESTIRKDQPISYLEKIKINDIIANKTIKEFSFSHTYFMSNEDFIPLLNPVGGKNTVNPKYFFRLKLDAITEIGYDEQMNPISKPPYSFEYYGNGFFPNKLNPGRDNWGFYNGENNTKTLIPTIAYQQFTDVNQSNFISLIDYSTWGGLFSSHTPNIEFAKLGSLKKINYPTGGYTEFDYELNTYIENLTEKNGAGLRIKSIKDFDGLGNFYNNQDFVYELGLLMEPLSFYKKSERLYMYCTLGGEILCKYIENYEPSTIVTFYSTSKIGQNRLAQGASIGYGKVTVKYNNGIDGYAIYEYQQNEYSKYDPSFDYDPRTEVLSDRRPPGIPFVNDRRNGKLIKKTIRNFKNEDLLIEEFQYKYLSALSDYQDNHDIVYVRSAIMEYGEGVCGCPSTYIPNFHIHIFPISVGRYVLDKRTSTKFEKNISFETITSYEYDDIYGYNNKIIIDYEDGNSVEIQKENVATSWHILDIYNVMNTKNLKTLPTKQTITKNNTLIKGAEILYKPYNNTYVVDQVKVLNNQTNQYETFVTYKTYSPQGAKVQTVVGNDNVPVSYIWAYNQTYPVAEFYNANNEDVSYCGFENSNTSNLFFVIDNQNWGNLSSNSFTTTNKHTGDFSCVLAPTQQWGPSKKIYPTSGISEYVFSAWLQTDTDFEVGTVNLVCQIFKKDGTVIYKDMKYDGTGGNWSYVSLLVDISNISNIDYLSFWIWNTTATTASPQKILIDDILVYPKQATVTYLTYLNATGQTSQTDVNAQSMFYEYDGLGRLQAVKNNDKDIMNFYEYEYNISN